MSDKIGPVELQSSGQVFTGQGYDQSSYSEKTAALVDEEVRRILNEGHEQALHILETHREQHKVIAEALLKYETLDEKEILRTRTTRRLTKRPTLRPLKNLSGPWNVWKTRSGLTRLTNTKSWPTIRTQIKRISQLIIQQRQLTTSQTMTMITKLNQC